MMSPVEKLSSLLFAATCVREIIDDHGTKSVAELNALARIHPGITDLMQRIKAEHGHALRPGLFLD
jgi:hypothetical protein